MLKEEGIWQYQVIQESAQRIRVTLVASQGVEHASMASRIMERFRETVGPEVKVEVEFVSDVQRTARGKVRPVISLQTRRWLREASASNSDQREEVSG
jgi:hypothetical protein